MRIVGGEKRGLKLDPPKDQSIRPTTDRVREALFNILAHRDDWRTDSGACPIGLKVLDVFAGTGALGLEALSRGAKEVWFIEQARSALGVLRGNIQRAKGEAGTKVLALNATRIGRAPLSFDLVFLDPPYGQGLAEIALQTLLKNRWLNPRTRIVVECDVNDSFVPPIGFDETDQRTYGRTRVHFLQIGSF